MQVDRNKGPQSAIPEQIDMAASTGLFFDLTKAHEALGEVLARYPFTDQRRQLSLMHRDAHNQSILDGTGSLFDFKERRWLARENEFVHFSNEFRHTYFFEIYQTLNQWSGGKIRRTRLMNLPPRACYSVHQDPSVRYHLVLSTNPHALFIFLNGRLVALPANGEIYRLDTRLLHTAMNGGERERIHLVFCEREDV